MMEAMIPSQVGMSLRTLYQKRPKKTKKGREKKKMREKREGIMLRSFYHTCPSKQHHDLHDRQPPMISVSYTSGNFHYRTWLVYSNDGLPQNALGLREQASWMHTHQFLLLSFHTFIALVHPLHGNPYSLTLISIDGNLHSPLIHLVDMRLSPSFCHLHNQRLFHLQ